MTYRTISITDDAILLEKYSYKGNVGISITKCESVISRNYVYNSSPIATKYSPNKIELIQFERFLDDCILREAMKQFQKKIEIKRTSPHRTHHISSYDLNKQWWL